MNKRGGTLSLNFSILLVASFVLAIMLFASQYARDNDAAVTIDSNDRLKGAGLLNGTITTYEQGTNTTVKAVYGGEVQEGSDSLDRVSTFETGGEDSLPEVGNVTKEAIYVLFGDNNNVLLIAGGFLAFLGLTYGLYAWKTFKQGAPD